MNCEGAPRDLGIDQARGSAAEIRAACDSLPVRDRLARLLPLLPLDEVAESVARDLRRYFPHLAERSAGLARGARVSRGELAALLARELGPGPAPATSGVVVVVEAESDAVGPLLARSAPRAALLRRSKPDNDYRSAELVVPWLVSPLLGVNEHGLGVAVVSRPEREARSGCRAPAVLLAQDCLQRFDSTQKALEWCERRPAGGCANLVLADASGDLAEVRIDGGGRTTWRSEGGAIVSASSDATADAVRKRLAALPRRDADALAALLADTPGATTAAVAHPAEYRLDHAGFSARASG